MGKFGGKKPAASIGSGSGKPIGGWPPAKGPAGGGKKDEDDAAADDEEESEFDEEEEEWSGSEGSSGELADMDGDDDGEDFEQSIKFMQQYLKDPLGAFMAAPDTQCDLATAQKIYAARAVVAADVDSKIGPSSAMADEYRKMELAHLKTLTGKLYAKRGAKAAAEVKEMSEADLAEDGTGLMWSMILDSVCESMGQKFPQDPIQFSDMESDVFNFCLNITPSYVDDDPFKGTVFTFDFAPNPFFENTQLRVAFHYAGANLSLDRVGIDVAAICGVECDTPVQFKPGHKFLSMPDELVREHERKAQKGMLETFFVGKDTTAEDKAAMERLMCMTPRPLFTSLFNTNTPAASREKIRKALVCGKDGDHSEDNSSHGLALVRSGTLELLPWKALVTGLTFVARAPMITAMDLEQGGQEMQGPGGPGGEEEEEEEDSDDDSAEEGGGKPAAGKKNRAEGGKAAAPQECKQQ